MAFGHPFFRDWIAGWGGTFTTVGLFDLGEAQLDSVGATDCSTSRQSSLPSGWMSSDPRLVAEIESLRSSLEALRLRVQVLEEERDPARADLAGTSLCHPTRL